MSLGWALIEKIGVLIKKKKKKKLGHQDPHRGECHMKIQTQRKDGHGKTETKT